MKIDIDPDGTVHIESNGSTPGDLAAFTLCMQRELRKERDAGPPKGTPAPVMLGTIMAETWDFLVEHDNPKGVHIQAVAQHFNISKETAGQRCVMLVNDGHAERVSMGRYRATDGGRK